MRKPTLVVAGVSLLAVSMSMSACGSRSDNTGSSTGSQDKIVKIGVIVPLTGDNASPGLGIKNSVELAIKQANEKKAVPGYTIELAAQDDQATPDVGKNAATSLAGDDQVIGVVGTLNSGVSQQVQPVLNSANIVQISPANTNPTLTLGAKWQTAPARPYKNYFRTCATDAVQGPYAAKYLLAAGIKKVATINDKQTYGQGLVGTFAEAFKAGGGTVTTAETVEIGETKFSTVISRVKSGSPDAVYYGGQYAEAGPLSAQLKQAGLKIPLMGGDGIFTTDFLQKAGKTSDGDLATNVGAPTESLPSAKQFVTDYKAAGYKEEFGAYGAYAYDATNAIIGAMKVSLDGAADIESARAKTIEEVAKVNVTGATGSLSFDEYGDTKIKVMTVYEVKGGKWSAVKTGS